MLRRIVLAAASCPLWFAPFTSPADAFEIEQIPTERGDVPLYLPSEIEPGERLPLIVSLHGFTGNGTEHENYFRLRNQVDDRRFMLCVPQGTRNSDGARFWNATDFCCDYEFQRPDDSGFIRGLIEQIADQKPVDLGSIHVTGHSNGGFMAYRFACDHADLVSSVASLAGATYYNTSNCVPSEPVHVLQIHGTQDDTIEYEDPDKTLEYSDEEFEVCVYEQAKNLTKPRLANISICAPSPNATNSSNGTCAYMGNGTNASLFSTWHWGFPYRLEAWVDEIGRAHV